MDGIMLELVASVVNVKERIVDGNYVNALSLQGSAHTEQTRE